MEIKLHTIKQPIGQKRNEKRSLNTLKQMKIEIEHQNLWDAAKTTLRGKLITINVYLEK